MLTSRETAAALQLETAGQADIAERHLRLRDAELLAARAKLSTATSGYEGALAKQRIALCHAESARFAHRRATRAVQALNSPRTATVMAPLTNQEIAEAIGIVSPQSFIFTVTFDPPTKES